MKKFLLVAILTALPVQLFAVDYLEEMRGRVVSPCMIYAQQKFNYPETLEELDSHIDLAMTRGYWVRRLGYMNEILQQLDWLEMSISEEQRNSLYFAMATACMRELDERVSGEND